jgi:hypothetical protein
VIWFPWLQQARYAEGRAVSPVFAGFVRAWYRCREARFFPQLGEEVHWLRQTEEVVSGAARRCEAIPRPAGAGMQDRLLSQSRYPYGNQRHALQVWIHDIGHAADTGEVNEFLGGKKTLATNFPEGFQSFIKADFVPLLKAVCDRLGRGGDQNEIFSMMCLLPFGSPKGKWGGEIFWHVHCQKTDRP